MEQWISFISDVGFPIIVTLYLLHRIEAKLEAVIQSIHGLTEHRKAQGARSATTGIRRGAENG